MYIYIWIILFRLLPLACVDATAPEEFELSVNFFAEFVDRMIPARNCTLSTPSHTSLEQCARNCRFNLFDESNSTNSKHHCLSFEYISSLGTCILLRVSTLSLRGGYGSLKHATGTSYYEFTKAPTSLFSNVNNHVLYGKDDYNKLLNITSLDSCARACFNSPGISCSSFAYSNDLDVCALSDHVTDTHHNLVQTKQYGYFQYNGNWPCNVTLPWRYGPRVIASQGFPYANSIYGTCYFRLIAPPNKQIVLKMTAYFNQKTICHSYPNITDGVYVYDTNGKHTKLMGQINEDTFSELLPSFKSTNGSLLIKISQTHCQPVTKLLYDYEKSNECDGHVCKNGAVCKPEGMAYTCYCVLGFTGKFCELNIDDCLNITCLFNGRCVDSINAYYCECLAGTMGKKCERYVGECHHDPCKNGTCTPTMTGYNCACAAGFTGKNCEYDFNECYSSPCYHGTCLDLVNGYACKCDVNYTGQNCEVSTGFKAECIGGDCRFGTCAVNGSGSFCQCFPGFTGIRCEHNIDDCETSPCDKGTCIDHVNAYRCICIPGYVGKHCDVFSNDPCRSKPCIHGYCSVISNNFTCICDQGFTGRLCDATLGSCDSNPCLHGHCSNTDSGFECKCKDNYTGRQCEEIANACLKNGCQHGHCIPVPKNATRDKISNAISYICNCRQGFTGLTCSEKLDFCHNGTCEHGTCKMTSAGYICQCEPYFTGSNCEHKISPCSLNRCGNRGTCQEHASSFSCVCHQGYTGTLCDSEINHCEPNPCINGGKCVEQNFTFFCRCRATYSGEKCEIVQSDVRTHKTSTPMYVKPTTQTLNPETATTFNTQAPVTDVNVLTHRSSLVPHTLSPLTVNVDQRTTQRLDILAGTSSSSLATNAFPTTTARSNPVPPSITNSPLQQLQTMRFPKLQTSSSMISVPATSKSQTVSRTTLGSLLQELKTSAELHQSIASTESTKHTLPNHGPHHLTPEYRNNTEHLPEYPTTLTPAEVTDPLPKELEPATTHRHATHKHTVSNSTSGVGSQGFTHPITISPFSSKQSKVTAILSTSSKAAHAGTAAKVSGFDRNNSTMASMSTIPEINGSPRVKSTTLAKTTHFTMSVIYASQTVSHSSSNTESITNTPTTVSNDPRVSDCANTSYEVVTKGDYCNWNTCIHGDCVSVKGDVVCKCLENYRGMDCSKEIESRVDDVITIESAVIGALAATLFVVVAVGIFILYRRTRRGSVYISPPPIKRNDTLNTSVVKRYSSRDIHSEQMAGGKHSLPPSPSSSSSQNSGGTTSSSSHASRYDDVETPSHHVVSCHQSQDKPWSRGRTVTFQHSNAMYGGRDSNYKVPRNANANNEIVVAGETTGNRSTNIYDGYSSLPNTTGDRVTLNNRTDGENPFFKQEDGTIGMRLSNRYTGRSPEDFQTLLDDILEEGDFMAFTKRHSVHQISGTENGKSDV